jgi:hypothetical protein
MGRDGSVRSQCPVVTALARATIITEFRRYNAVILVQVEIVS